MKQFVSMVVWLGLLLAGAGAALGQTKTPLPVPAPAGAAPAAAAPPRYQPGKLSTDPAQFIADVGSMMLATNNAAARNVGIQLRALWASNRLTSSQQARIVALSQVMLAKRFKPRPHFEAVFGAIVGGATTAKLSDQQMDQYLDVLGQTLEKESPTETQTFMFATNRFLNGGYLYRSGYNTLRAVGGTVSFAYSPVGVPESSLEFGAPVPDPAPVPLPAPKPAAPKDKAPAKPTRAAAKPQRASSSGWDSADMWSNPGGGWGDGNDGWGAPVKKKAPAKPAAKSTAKGTAAPAKTEPAATAADFNEPPAFTPSALTYAAYQAPPTRGPVIVVKDVDLFMATAGDSVFIKKVSGTAVPGSNRFVGTSGQFVWSVRTNLVTAELTGFDFNMGKPEFTAEPVTLTYPAMLEAPVKGALSYKSMRRKPGATETGYPRFISLTNDARLKNLGANIQYRGGLSMAGSRVLSAALDGSLSNITVSLDGKPKFRASSRTYVLGDSLITASRAAVTIYEGAKDSVTHPGTELKYIKAKQELKLDREKGLYKTTPYSDSYHQLDIRTDEVTWNLKEPTINFAVLTGKNHQTTDFESKEFFTNVRYQQLKSINRIHPLQMLVGYSQAHKNAKTVNVTVMATELNVTEPNLRSAMASLARDGYAQWNPQTGEATVLPKGRHYVAAFKEKKDYDHLAIKSLSGSGRNATLNLNTSELLVRGVERFNFSDDSATVFVRPDSAIIRIQKNRNIDFGGTVVASAMRFRGRNFKFDYDGFYVDMAKIDSIVIRSEGKDARGKANGKHADFALTNKGKVSTGRLYLNDPRNKSGRKKMKQYPAFDSKSGANVYFGQQGVLGGAYDSTMVFDIPPFRLDSLNGLTKAASGFDGTFRSGGIIPDLKTKLTIQEDGALGFVYDVPKDGFPLYRGKGRVFNKVRMNGRGLQGDGLVTYQSGTFTSDAFVFYRDSVVTVGRTGNIAARKGGGVDIPKVNLPAGYLMNWKVKQDSMYLSTPLSGEPLRLYSAADNKNKTVKSYNFKGTALLTPKALGGNGRLDGPQSYIKSPEFTFKSDSYSGRKAVVNIKSAEDNKPALTANDVSFDYELKKGYADFKREPGSKATIDLPYSKFKTSLSGGHWDFRKKQVKLRVAAGGDSTKSYFYGTSPEQLGLKFQASAGVYDLAKYRMRVSGVPYIAAADAWITPDSGKVAILPGGRLQRFRNAGIVLDSVAKFHRLVRGNVEVLSRLAFAGSAEYSYKTARDSVILRFANFEPDPAAVLAGFGRNGNKKLAKRNAADGEETAQGIATVATAVVSSATRFQLTPRIGYRGNVQLNSQRRGFVFDGQVQLQFGKDRALGDWIAVKDSIDPKNFSLNLQGIKGEDGSPLLTGLFLSDANNRVYPLYATPVRTSTDISLFEVDGQLRHDDKAGMYSISRHDPNDANLYEGAVLTYTDATNALSFRGPMTFIKSTKDFAMVGAAVGTANPDSARYTVDALLGLDFTMTPKAIDLMGSELARVTKNSPDAQDASTNELYKMAQFIGDKAVESYAQRRGVADPLIKLSPKLQHTITLNRVNLRWSERRRAWYSVGPIGIAGVGKQSMNALINGIIEIKREANVDVVEMYLEGEPQSWYYFKYAGGLLLTKGQSEDYNNEIASKVKGDYNTATSYAVFLGEFSDVDGFRSRFQQDYLGKKKLAPRAAAPVPTGNFDVFDDKKTRKKKAKEAEDAGNADPAADPAPTDAPAPEPEPTKKKKKKAKANDPFGDGVMDEPAPPPVKKTVAPAPTPKPTPPAKAPADTTAARTNLVPAADSAAGAKATKPAATPAAPTPPTAEPAAAPAPSPADEKKEAARQAKEAERLLKEEEKKKKDEEKRKKKAASDPFGDN